MARKQRTSKETKELFRDPSGQPHLFEKSYQEELEAKAKKEVECLGMTFENDEARRAYFLEKLKEKLKDPEFRKIEGFPTSSGCLFCMNRREKSVHIDMKDSPHLTHFNIRNRAFISIQCR